MVGNLCIGGRSVFIICVGVSVSVGIRGYSWGGSIGDSICVGWWGGISDGRCSSIWDGRSVVYISGDIVLFFYLILGFVCILFSEFFVGLFFCYFVFDGIVVSMFEKFVGCGRGMCECKRCGVSVVMFMRGWVVVEGRVVFSKSKSGENKDERDEIGGKYGCGWVWKEVEVDLSRGVMKECGGKECKLLCSLWVDVGGGLEWDGMG